MTNYLTSELLAVTNYTISGLQEDTSYEVLVVAVSAAGEGDRAAAMQVRTNPIGKMIFERERERERETERAV